MSRERMVTRTVEEATISALIVHVAEQKTGNAVYRISATIGEENALKYIQKHFDTDSVKTVAILSYSVSQTLYGMPEADFIKLAKVLPPRNVASEE